MNRKSLLGFTTILFVIYEIVAFYQIHIKMNDIDNKIRYACIIAAAMFSWATLFIELVTAKSEGEKALDIIFSLSDGNLLRIAMIFTLIADYFMVALEEADNLTGVTVFLGTQLFIFLHIMVNDTDRKSRVANIVIRVFLMAVIALAVPLVLGEDGDLLSLLSVIYFANLCVNTIFAHRIGRGGMLLTVGLFLFALCDINVGLSGLNSIYTGGLPEGSLLYKLANAEVDLIWLFYIPSQTLIPMTLLYKQKNK